jgi:hypothetical protein
MPNPDQDVAAGYVNENGQIHFYPGRDWPSAVNLFATLLALQRQGFQADSPDVTIYTPETAPEPIEADYEQAEAEMERARQGGWVFFT